MGYFLLPLFALVVQPAPKPVVLTGHSGRHTYEVGITERPFDSTKHKIAKNKSGHITIDGKPENSLHPLSDGSHRNWYGTDGGLPSREISAFSVRVDGKLWKFPPNLWRDCYGPHEEYAGKQKLLWVWLTKDGKHLTVKMLGSDGAGSYLVLWFLHRDRHATRKTESNTG
jgi:hypothetical protein